MKSIPETPAKHLAGESVGYAFAVPGNEKLCLYAVRALPRIGYGDNGACHAVGTLYAESGRVFRLINGGEVADF